MLARDLAKPCRLGGLIIYIRDGFSIRCRHRHTPTRLRHDTGEPQVEIETETETDADAETETDADTDNRFGRRVPEVETDSEQGPTSR